MEKKSADPHYSSSATATTTVCSTGALPHTGLPHTAPGAPPPPLFNPAAAAAAAAAAAGLPGFPGFPLMDMSSTQVLLNMVRNASAAQQSQLENYLRGAMKRPADAPPTSPLDLSASVGAKRSRGDPTKPFDVKSLFGFPTEDDRKVGPPPPPPHHPQHPQLTHSVSLAAEYKNGRTTTSPPGTTTSTTTSPPPAIAPARTRQAATPSPSRTSTAVSCGDRNCTTAESIAHWTVEDVCSFVAGIDLCAEYVEAFREQRIDGSALALLTEEHLTTSIHMRLGPALKLRSVLAKRLGACGVCLHCDHCHAAPPPHLAHDPRRPPSVSASVVQ